MNTDLHRKLCEVTGSLCAVHERLSTEIYPNLISEIDRIAIRRIITDLSWAIENCTVVGKHQIGEALDDTMGIT